MVANPNRIMQIHELGGTFLGGYTGYSLTQVWDTVMQDYADGYGHFASNADYNWDSQGSPFMAIVNKQNMKILSNDALDLINNFDNATLSICQDLAE